MPTIIIIFGIHIIMNQIGKEHGIPHVHAIYGDERGVFSLEDGNMIEGNLKPKKQKIVKDFILTYQKVLLKMWDTGDITKIKV